MNVHQTVVVNVMEASNTLLSGAKQMSPRLSVFHIFFAIPLDLLRTPSFITTITIKEIDFFYEPLISSHLFVSTIHAHIHGKIECICIYSSSMLYDNLFLFFPSF